MNPALTLPVADEPAWVCVRCGLVEQYEFTWAHRPATNPGIRTCGGQAVPANVYFQAVMLIRIAWFRSALQITRAESNRQSHPELEAQLMDIAQAYEYEYGPLTPPAIRGRVSSGAYGLWQTI